MKQLLFFVLLSLMTQPLFAQQTTSEVPYIYYYSDVLDGIVIERADGTDSRLIPSPERNSRETHVAFGWNFWSSKGGGWSPSGRWFAYSGRVLGIDGRFLPHLGEYTCVEMLLWHPVEDMLLVFGTHQPPDTPCSWYVFTYTLIDPNAATILASVTMQSYIMEGNPAVYWLDQSMLFKQMKANYGSYIYSHVIMHYDGRVEIVPVPEEQWKDTPANVKPDRRGISSATDVENPHPEFVLHTSLTYEGQELPFDPPLNSSQGGRYLAWLWHSGGDWLLVGYEGTGVDSATIERVSVYNWKTGQYREISSCGIDFTCVGWLPAQVPLDKMIVGQPTSVLPAPLSYEPHDRGGTHFHPTHTIVCSDTPESVESQIRNWETGDIEYMLLTPASCRGFDHDNNSMTPLRYNDREVVFALSPDQRFYAVTDTPEAYTRLQDAQTGETLAELNIVGYMLAFSPENEMLYTSGAWTTAEWKIEDLITR